MVHRNNSHIIYQILQRVSDKGQEGSLPTPLMNHANLSSASFKKIMSRIIQSEFVVKIEHKKHQTYVITDAGRIYLKEYLRFYEMIQSFGLEP